MDGITASLHVSLLSHRTWAAWTPF